MSAAVPFHTVVNVVVPVFLVAGLGYLWARRGQPYDSAFTTSFAVNVATPCLVFTALSQARLDGGGLGLLMLAALMSLMVCGVVAVSGLTAARLPLRPYLPALMFPNAGNMGIPVCLFAFGELGMAYAVAFFTAISVTQFVVGPAIAAGRADWRRAATTPMLPAVALALALRAAGIAVPQWLANTTGLLGNCAVPLMLIALGVALARLTAHDTGRVLILSAVRIGLGLVVGLLVAGTLGLSGTMRSVVIIQCSMPVAVFNYLWAQRYNNAPEDVAGMVLGSTLLSFVSLPLILLFAA